MRRLVMAGFVLAMAVLGCGQPAEEWQLRGWTVTPSPFNPTQTPYVKEVTTTPVSTYTPIIQIVTETPSATLSLCVDAVVAVHLRPSPSEKNYPITVLLNKTVLEDLGGRSGESGEWMFVKHGEQSGWVNSNYVIACNKVQE